MAPKKIGKRHALLFYHRTMGRLFGYSLVLGALFAAAWWFSLLRSTTFLFFRSETLLLIGAVICIGISIFALIARSMAYVQVYPNYLRFVTPFLRIKISYRRIRSARPALVQQIFPKEESSWAEQNFLAPFYGKSAIILELRGYPVKLSTLKLLLPKQMFSPRSMGFVLVVSDWMALSTELDSFRDAWMHAYKKHVQAARAESDW